MPAAHNFSINLETTSAPMSEAWCRLRWAVLIAPAVVAAALSAWGTSNAPGTYQDSIAYVCGAQTLLAKGALLICGRDWPLIRFPPVYPLMLAALDILGIRGLDGVRVICALSFAFGTLLTGVVVAAATSSLFMSIIGELLFLSMGDIVTANLYAMSEAPFLVFLLLFIFWMWRALEDDRMRWVLLAGVAAAIACMTRYIGASMVFSGVAGLVWFDRGPRRRMLIRVALFLAISGVPVGLWIRRNFAQTASLTGRDPGFYYPLEPNQYFMSAQTVVRWFLPLLSTNTCLAMGGAVIVALFLTVAAVIFWNPGKLPWLLAVFALSDAVFIVASRIFADPYITLAERMLVPILASLLILTLVLVHSTVTAPGASILWRRVAVAIAILSIVANAARAKEILAYSHNVGLEMSRRYYRDSALIAWLSRLPADTVIYSDEPEPIYFFAGRFAEQLPMTTDPTSKLPLGSLTRETNLMRDRLGGHPGVIVYFNKASPYRLDNIPPPGLMPSVYGLSIRELIRNSDGAIYEMHPASGLFDR